VMSSKPGVVRWEVPWDNLLFAEAGTSPRDPGPAILVHVRYSATRLFHRARCPPPATPTASCRPSLRLRRHFGAAQAATTVRRWKGFLSAFAQPSRLCLPPRQGFTAAVPGLLVP